LLLICVSLATTYGPLATTQTNFPVVIVEAN
jgi:hypothetical protein